MKKYTLAVLALLAAVSGANASIWGDIKREASGKWERFKDDPAASLGRGRDTVQGYAETAGSVLETGQGLYDKYGTTVFGEEGSTGVRADTGAYAAGALAAAERARQAALGLTGGSK